MQKDFDAWPTQYWQKLDDGRVECQLCPRLCKMREGQRGLCFIRAAHEGEVVLTTYGRSAGYCIDPIDKKPLNHFYPGSPVLSFGTAGCNLTCKFCQNHDVSKARKMDAMQSVALPHHIANAARNAKALSVAYTYNDPVIFHEYAIDVAKACHKRGVKNVAVSAGYVMDEPRAEFYAHMDAANIDLKSFSEDFYHKLTTAHLAPVLETLEYIHHQTNCWLEITTLLIPGENDSPEEIRDLAYWVGKNLSPEVPVHFSAFHPDYRMLDKERTPRETLLRAYRIAKSVGLHHVYIGNAHDDEARSSFCAHCKAKVISRKQYEITGWALEKKGHCQNCGTKMAGHFANEPGDWGNQRRPVRIVAVDVNH